MLIFVVFGQTISPTTTHMINPKTKIVMKNLWEVELLNERAKTYYYSPIKLHFWAPFFRYSNSNVRLTFASNMLI